MVSKFKTTEISDGKFDASTLQFITVKSDNLKSRGDICVYVPKHSENKSFPIVILLHGVYGSAWVWALKGGAHQVLQKLIDTGQVREMILAMPSDGLWGDGSGYFTHNQINFEKWIAEDIPAAIDENIDCANAASPLFIAGLSMGGYGAMRIGSKYAGKFSAISAHSSLTDFKQLAMFVEEDLSNYKKREPDLSVLSSLLEAGANLPPLRFDCGKDDPLLPYNRALSTALKEKKVKHIYKEFSGGHEWTYWQKHIKETLIFFDNHLKQ